MAVAPEYTVDFFGNAEIDGHTDYYIRVNDLKTNQSWELTKRYREIRELHEHLKLRYPDKIPTFPGKRIFNSLDPEFVRERQRGLQL